jgi:3-methyladenine DNA glycosylase AlkD
MTARVDELVAALAAEADPARATGTAAFFKTGRGEYGEGDIFLGLAVPTSRKIARRFRDLSLAELDELLDSDVHEHRFVALVILNSMAVTQPAEAASFYLAAIRRGRVNNWDLVDASAEFVLGEYLFDRPRDVLFELAAADSLWERRVALLATFGFIKHGDATTTLEIAERLLGDRRDLIQKAVGWMLREVGKRVDRSLLLGFLDTNAGRMGRTALSYATEHLTAEQRAAYRAVPVVAAG